MSCEPFGQNQIDSEKIQWKDSIYRFTEPVRYFKSNDPYYWEVDNIPIKQLEENVLWLKEQLGTAGTFELSGIGRKDFLELKPVTDGSTRKVQVLPGKFLARINDAYFKGIGSITKENSGTLGTNGFLERRYKFNITTSVLKKLVGDLLGSPLYCNGLYDHLQHHAVSRASSNTLIDWTNISIPALNTKAGILNIPKNKLALWRQSSTSTNFGSSASDLQQLSVDLTRAWGGTARTALVNVTEPLEITIPDFDQDDYMNKTSFTPRVRFDLLFVYSHPADAESTTIAAANGESPTTITTPQLGIVKGAGVVKIKGTGQFTNYDSRDSNSDTFFSDGLYQDNVNTPTNYFTAEDGMDDENNYQIISPMSDNNQTGFGAGGVFGNLPSPDDLMNLAPLLQEGLSDSFSLVGQTVLPIAYVIVREGQSAILEDDIIDIRPFFRTAELAYNERAGVAAANPPLSFANPAVGKHELSDSIQKSSNHVLNRVFALETLVGSYDHSVDDGGGGDPTTPIVGNSIFITKGAVLGGTKYGVEGAILHLEAEFGGVEPATTVDELVDILRKRHLPGLTELPILPGWDVAQWCKDLGSNAGDKRNDRINSSIKLGATYWKHTGPGAWILNQYVSPVADNNQNWSAQRGNNSNYGGPDPNVSNKIVDYDLIYYIKKRMSVSLPANVKDYEVRCNFVSCIPATGAGVSPELKSGPRSTNNYGGIFVEKHQVAGDKAEFTIFVPFSPGIQNMVNEVNHWYGMTPQNTGSPLPAPPHNSAPFSSQETGGIEEKRIADSWSAFRVVSNLGDMNMYGNRWDYQTNPHRSSASNATLAYINPTTLPPMMVTYPTVEFSITGYTNDFNANYISDTSEYDLIDNI
tara:strand:+ start:2484 stop:5078 length:2595 start_codon:yes stop_codon:yes gene_type:complete